MTVTRALTWTSVFHDDIDFQTTMDRKKKTNSRMSTNAEKTNDDLVEEKEVCSLLIAYKARAGYTPRSNEWNGISQRFVFFNICVRVKGIVGLCVA